MTPRRSSPAYINSTGWYRWRNDKMVDQTATMTDKQIAEYWKLNIATVRDILRHRQGE